MNLKLKKFSNIRIHGFKCTKPVGYVKFCVYFQPVGYSDLQGAMQL